MQNANFGRRTAAPDILKTSTSLSNLNKLFKRANIFTEFFFYLQKRYENHKF